MKVRVSEREVGRIAEVGTDRSVALHEYCLEAPDCAVTVLAYGATLVGVEIPDCAGRRQNVVLSYADRTRYGCDRTNGFHIGGTLGRFARSVTNGRLLIDGEAFNLSRNIGTHHFHGGRKGFDRQHWAVRTEILHSSARVVMDHFSAAGHEGYPGALHATIIYQLSADNVLLVAYRATSDAPTLVGMAPHAFWNLGGSGTICGHMLSVNAQMVVDMDDEHIPTGHYAPVSGSVLDFRMPRSIGGGSIDNCFRLADPGWAARLVDPVSGRYMDIATDQPALAIYSGDGLPAARAGICLQPSPLPYGAEPVESNMTILRPGQIYQRSTTFRFGFSEATAHAHA